MDRAARRRRLGATVAKIEAAVLSMYPAAKDIADVRAEYEIRLSRAVTSVLNGESSAKDLERTHWALIRAYAMQVYLEGMRDGGISDAGPDDLTSGDEQTIRAWEQGQKEFIAGLAEAAAAAADLPKGTPERRSAQAGVNSRVDLWGQSLRDLGNEGKASALKNMMVTWRLGRTEEHCETCVRLNGTRRRVSWFMDRDYRPQMNGAAMDCGGWRCECKLVDDKGKQVMP